MEEKILVNLPNELIEKLGDNPSDLIKVAVENYFCLFGQDRRICFNCIYSDNLTGSLMCLVHNYEITDSTNTCESCLTKAEKEKLEKNFKKVQAERLKAEEIYNHNCEILTSQFLRSSDEWKCCKSCKYYFDGQCEANKCSGLPLKLLQRQENSKTKSINPREWICDKYEVVNYSERHVLSLDLRKIISYYLFEALKEHKVLSEPSKIQSLRLDFTKVNKLKEVGIIKEHSFNFREEIINKLVEYDYKNEPEAMIDFLTFKIIKMGLGEI